MVNSHDRGHVTATVPREAERRPVVWLSSSTCEAMEGESGTGCSPQTAFARGRRAVQAWRAVFQTIQAVNAFASMGSGMISRCAAPALPRTRL